MVQIMVWCRPVAKPLSEPMMVRLLTHICTTWPQWVKNQQLFLFCFFKGGIILGELDQHNVLLMTWLFPSPCHPWRRYWPGRIKKTGPSLPLQRLTIILAISQGLEIVQNAYKHYNDVIMGAIASQITRLTIVFSTVYLDTDQRKHQSSASLAFVRGIHRRPVHSPHKGPLTRKMFPFDDVIMNFPLNNSACNGSIQSKCYPRIMGSIRDLCWQIQDKQML